MEMSSGRGFLGEGLTGERPGGLHGISVDVLALSGVRKAKGYCHEQTGLNDQGDGVAAYLDPISSVVVQEEVVLQTHSLAVLYPSVVLWPVIQLGN